MVEETDKKFTKKDQSRFERAYDTMKTRSLTYKKSNKQ